MPVTWFMVRKNWILIDFLEDARRTTNSLVVKTLSSSATFVSAAQVPDLYNSVHYLSALCYETRSL